MLDAGRKILRWTVVVLGEAGQRRCAESRLARDAAEQGDEADEAFGGMVARMDMPPHARAG